MMKKIPEIFKQAGYKHIPEDELKDMYDSLPENHTMYHIDAEYHVDAEINKKIEFGSVEFGKYLKREERKAKLKKISKMNED